MATQHKHSAQAWKRNSIFGRIASVRNQLYSISKTDVLIKSEKAILDLTLQDINNLLTNHKRNWLRFKKRNWK